MLTLVPEVANGSVASGRSRSRGHSHFSLLAPITVGLVLLITPTEASALTLACWTGEATAIALCQADTCTAGFKAKDEVIPATHCDTCLVVRDLAGQERANFGHLVQHLEQGALSGIYQLLGSPVCLDGDWRDERCLSTVEVTRLADASAPTLTQHEAEWRAKERRSHLAATLRSWGRAFKLSLTALLVVAWPWILVMLKPKLKKGLLYLAVAALPLQLLIALPWQVLGLLGFDFEQLPHDYPREWPYLAEFMRVLIIVAVPLQFGYLLRQKLKPATE